MITLWRCMSGFKATQVRKEYAQRLLTLWIIPSSLRMLWNELVVRERLLTIYLWLLFDLNRSLLCILVYTYSDHCVLYILAFSSEFLYFCRKNHGTPGCQTYIYIPCDLYINYVYVCLSLCLIIAEIIEHFYTFSISIDSWRLFVKRFKMRASR